MKGNLDICGNDLSPLRGLFNRRTKPTAHAVGYCLTALRTYKTAAIDLWSLTEACSSRFLLHENVLTETAEQRQSIAHGRSCGLASQIRKPRKGHRKTASDHT